MSLDNLVDVRKNHKFNILALQDWLNTYYKKFGNISVVKQIVGGQSNPTFVIFFESKNKIILRKKPPGKLLPSAHDISREYKIQSALEKTNIPCPKMILFCEDTNIIGTEFYLMEVVSGKVYENILQLKNKNIRKSLYFNLAKILAEIHNINFATLGLDSFGKKGNYSERQINRWEKQWYLSKKRDFPKMSKIIKWLRNNNPVMDETTIVHGDFRLGNVIVENNNDKIIAILDWELSTLGHPYADLGYLLHPHFIPYGQRHGLRHIDFKKENTPTVEDITEIYCKYKNIKKIDPYFYIVLSMFRSIAILEGVYARYLDGNESSPNAKKIGEDVEPLINATYEIIKNL